MVFKIYLTSKVKLLIYYTHVKSVISDNLDNTRCQGKI